MTKLEQEVLGEIKSLATRVDSIISQYRIMEEALEKLAKLGNGDYYGNSTGNDIAIRALKKARTISPDKG